MALCFPGKITENLGKNMARLTNLSLWAGKTRMMSGDALPMGDDKEFFCLISKENHSFTKL